MDKQDELLLTDEERYKAGWGRDQNFDIDTLLEAQVTKVLDGRLDRPELMKQAKEIVLSIRQYLCNTEFAPEPFTEPVDLNKLTVVFPKKILALIIEAKREEKERIIEVIESYNSIGYPYGADYKRAVLQALREGK